MFRVRARRFPGLVNCTSTDWFHSWPQDALVSVAQRFLKEADLGTPEIAENVSYHMAEVHLSVTNLSAQYLTQQRRYNYTTLKSYLELIGFYKYQLELKRTDLNHQIDRLDTGLSTLKKTKTDVEQLKVDLKIQMSFLLASIPTTPCPGRG